MAKFVIRYAYDPALAETRAARLSEHRDWLAGLDARGDLLTAGAFADGTGAVLAIAAPDAEAAASTMDADPFWTGGLVADRSIDEWNVRWGPLA
ncbi:YciI family protein [Nocardia alni]|uniref:YciI family protein n=1 Tax=Nocardia alni TaxID=2815723 RepID=UPI001C232C3A|nr:YciI family protein [Nocardia alni]